MTFYTLTSACTFSILFTIHFLKCWQGEFIYGHLSTYIIGSKMLTVFQEWSLRKTVSFKRQIMSKVKYSYMLLGKIEAFVFIILQIVCNTCGKEFVNSLLYAVWGVFFGGFSGMTQWTKTDFPSSVITTKPSLILN